MKIYKFIAKNVLFLLFCISFVSCADFADFFDLRPWPVKIYDWFKNRVKTKAKQEAMINQLEKESENTFNEFQEIYHRTNKDWEKVLRERKEKKEELQKKLQISREDYHHDPELSFFDKMIFKRACKLSGINPYAINVYLSENLDNGCAAHARFVNNCPAITISKKTWKTKSLVDKIHILNHEITHIIKGDSIDNNIIEECFKKYCENLKTYNPFKNAYFWFFNIYEKKYLEAEQCFIQMVQSREGIADLLMVCKSKRNNRLAKRILEQHPPYVTDDNHLNSTEYLHLINLIYHRVWAQDSEKTIEDIIKYDKRCNEAPLIKSTFDKRKKI